MNIETTVPRPTLSKLLLDEEIPEVRQLPCAGSPKHNSLNNRPANDTGISGLGLVAEFDFPLLDITISHSSNDPPHVIEPQYPLENLLPLDIVQPGIQILHPLNQVVDPVLILAFNFTGLPDSQVKMESDALWVAKPRASRRGVSGKEANAMLARVGCGEGEAPFV